jgi:hypothetical protein
MSYIGNSPISAAFLTDTFSGTGSQTAFTMTVAPANTSSIIVAITGVLQDPSTYSVSGTTLTFSAAPPSGTSNISVRYLGIPASGVTTTAYRTVTNTTATAGQTSFTIPSYTVGYVDVYRNGVYLPTSDYTATTGTTVVLTNAATVGDTITTISFYVSSVLNAIPATAGAVSNSYLAALSTITTSTGGTITIPTPTGTMMVSGNMPAFGAYPTSGTSVTLNTWTKVLFDTEEFDTNNNFASSRFTPTVAGYYQINSAYQSPATSGNAYIAIYKNGSIAKFGSVISATSVGVEPVVSSIIYCNGSTDYIEIYAYSSVSMTITAQSQNTYINGCLLRTA